MLSLALADAEHVERVSSSTLAKGIGANPSFLRKLIVPLVREGLVSAASGRDGGVRLGRSPDTITLCDIYRAVIGEKSIWSPREDVPHQCLVSSNVEQFFRSLADQANEAVYEVLEKQTLAQSLDALRSMNATTPKRVRSTSTRPRPKPPQVG
ncbi:hypothetical protein A6V36_13845 [Paraburkholderia ginsengiterrae]|uniref:Rrf2 family transcriptional regulator n=2 Tax=Paraburkholderia ginsengiterrae TaxID=1462993 RepID=A0A1A9MXR8_9BURK|nr:hypothetical protein A6V36_13845 [Paraburkholderia ginsengiterrae]OAJ52637.1 hypothetical protein A6V37_09360 [Paraburkholderia ginsengiterrae]